MSTVLKTESLTMQFGGLKAVSEVSLSIPEHSIFGLIGPNGAGKTTFFNMLTGVYTPTSGKIEAFGKNAIGYKPAEITRIGLARTFQNIRLFKKLTVLENVMISIDQARQSDSPSPVATLFKAPSFLKFEQEQKEKALEYLKRFNLDGFQNLLAMNLSYGDQRKLEIARALATGAQLLLLDEPAAGMNPNETLQLMNTIRKLRDDMKVTILLIEHDMKLVMGVCERIAVLDYGVKIAEGTPQEIQKNEKVIEAYLGKAATHAVH